MLDPMLMDGFPPAAATQVTLANWRQPPFCRWGFQHVRELIPTANVAASPAATRPLPAALVDFAGFQTRGLGGASIGFDAYLTETGTDGIVVLRDGKLVAERYANGLRAETPHILMSVSKSILALVTGILVDRGQLDPDKLVTDYVPEVASTIYRGASVRNLLDMRVGIKFNEDYLATEGTIIAYRKATGWNPLGPGETASDLRTFYAGLTEPDGQHGGRFHYVSPNTDLLGWVVERAAGRRYADLASDLLWKPMGAEFDAYITVDRFGAPRCAGGFCATTRDLARLGQLVADHGQVRSGAVVSRSWLDDIETNGDPVAWKAGSFVELFESADMHYRSKWYVARGKPTMMFGFGVHGQFLFVDRANGIVVAKVSSQDLPIDAERTAVSVRGARDLIGFLARG